MGGLILLLAIAHCIIYAIHSHSRTGRVSWIAVHVQLLATLGALAGLGMGGVGWLLLLLCGGLSVFIWRTTGSKQQIAGLPDRKS